MSVLVLIVKEISHNARVEIRRAGGEIHDNVLQPFVLDEYDDYHLVTIPYDSYGDLRVFKQHNILHEIQVDSRKLELLIAYKDRIIKESRLITMAESYHEEEAQQKEESESEPPAHEEVWHQAWPDGMDDLDEHPF